MKKMLALILSLCLLVALTACGSKPEPSTDPTTIPVTQPTSTPDTVPSTAPTTEPGTPTEPEVTEPIIYDLPMTAISITEQSELCNNSDGECIFEYTYQNIRLLLPDAELSLSVNLDILNRIDSTRATATDIMNDALNANPEYPYSYSIIYTPMRVDGNILSLFGQSTSYSGGSAIHTGHGLTYDLVSGAVLTLEDVLVPGITADVICPLVIDALASLPEGYYIFSDFADTVESRFAGDFLIDTGWHFSDDGLCFTFAPYEVAPNSSGFIHALIPYEELTGILQDAWFPVEKVTPNGSLEVIPFSQEDTEQFEQFAELYLNREGGSYLLHSTGLIYDIIIESGSWNMDGTIFTPEKTVFQANSLVPSDAIMLQTDIPDTEPTLRITYTGAEGTVSVYFSKDSADGSPLLTA